MPKADQGLFLESLQMRAAGFETAAACCTDSTAIPIALNAQGYYDTLWSYILTSLVVSTQPCTSPTMLRGLVVLTAAHHLPPVRPRVLRTCVVSTVSQHLPPHLQVK